MHSGRTRKDKRECDIMTTQFFLPMKSIPTVTQQEHKIAVRNGKPIIYEPARLKAARDKFAGLLSAHVPSVKYTRGVRLLVKWLFPVTRGHVSGEYKLTKPDTDNLLKMFKDEMTRLGFWKDDALVCSEINEKFYSDVVGVFVRIEDIGNGA